MGYKLDIKRQGGSVVSDGTLRSEDLLPKLCDALYSLGKKQLAKDLYKEGQVALDTIKRLEDASWRNELSDEDCALYQTAWDTISWIINEDLFDALNENAPKGYYFSSHEGDGACFGFWKEEKW
jgi:hypothetical protein